MSFEVRQGEVVGVIGRNGAGKSTLLKILSRITEPTEGRVRIKGRVASLLEVGTGFHPELTGRENIFLNGAILGMHRAEIKRKFDEIVAFAEVEKFLDTPVKRYSSGMYVRLAFAVAAHLQPQILLMDEVLAVGDKAFQKKCIGRMEQIASEGKTVLIVSHSMSTVKALCSRAMLLEAGRIKAIGPVDAIVGEYLSSNQADVAEKVVADEDHYVIGSKAIRVRRVRLLDPPVNNFSVYWRQPIRVALEIEVTKPVARVAFGAGIRALDGTHIFHVHHEDDRSKPLWDFEPGHYLIELTLDNPLRPGLYKLHFGADIEHIEMKLIFGVDAVTLEVLDHSKEGLVPKHSNSGLVNGDSVWKSPKRI
ncbi:MAG: ABC transporter ATP-binding protein [Verrucomicrobia bacterium]|nr:ABC transporter ATP-binding protein [Verrucomicrobiota bacterium]